MYLGKQTLNYEAGTEIETLWRTSVRRRSLTKSLFITFAVPMQAMAIQFSVG